MSNKNFQIRYTTENELSSKTATILTCAGHKKSLLISLALNEFAEKYGFHIDSKEEIAALIKNYDYFRRINSEGVYPQTVPAYSPAPVNVQTEEITQEVAAPEEKKEPEEELFPQDELVISDKQRAAAMHALQLFSTQ